MPQRFDPGRSCNDSPRAADARPHAARRGRVKRWRRANRGRFNALLIRLLGRARVRRRALAGDTRRILVVRSNKRLGNVLFLTPMLRSLAGALPGARIDVLVRDPAHRPLLEHLPGVDRVHAAAGGPLRAAGLLWSLRRRHYDLAIDPSGNSTSNRFIMALCGARQRMGFAFDNQWLRLSHAAPRPHSRHQALQAVELLAASVAGIDFEAIDTLAVAVDAASRERAADIWRGAVGADAQHTVGFFVQATGQKQMPADWWRAWRAEIAGRAPAARLLQICPPDAPAPLFDDTARLCSADLSVLAALLARLDVFIAADSGPMHLAAAAGVPVVGLFQATQPQVYAPLGRDCTTLAGDALTPEDAARAVAERLARA